MTETPPDSNAQLYSTDIEHSRDSRSIRRVASCSIVAMLLAGTFAWFVWPTAYRYDRLDLKGNTYPVRIERWSGEAEVLYGSGWTIVGADKSGDKKGPKFEGLPTDALAKLETTAERSLRTITIHLYGSSE